MGNIIDFQERMRKRHQEEGVLDFGKPYEELTDTEIKFVLDQFKELYNSLFSSLYNLQEVVKINTDTMTRLVEKSKEYDEFNSEVVSLIDSIQEFHKKTNDRFDTQSKLINLALDNG